VHHIAIRFGGIGRDRVTTIKTRQKATPEFQRFWEIQIQI
jgi:hypothetical protein